MKNIVLTTAVTGILLISTVVASAHEVQPLAIAEQAKTELSERLKQRPSMGGMGGIFANLFQANRPQFEQLTGTQRAEMAKRAAGMAADAPEMVARGGEMADRAAGMVGNAAGMADRASGMADRASGMAGAIGGMFNR